MSSPYPFRMYGRIIEINRYSVTSQEPISVNSLLEEENAIAAFSEQAPAEDVNYFPTQEEANAFAESTGGTVTPLNTSGYEWLDGIEVDDVPDTMTKAIEIYEAGQTAYEESQNQVTPPVLEGETTDESVRLGTNQTFSTDSNSPFTSSVLIGSYASSNSNKTTVIGSSARSLAANSTAVGATSSADGVDSVALGISSRATGSQTVAIGASSISSGDASIVLGFKAKSIGANSISIGSNTTSWDDNSIAVGNEVTASDSLSTAVGSRAKASGGSVALGFSANASSQSSTALGIYANSSGTASIAVGYFTNASGVMSSAIGYSATSNGNYSTAVGSGAVISSTETSTIRLGGDDVSALKCKVNLSVTSDIRDKANIQAMNNCLNFINELTPIQYVGNPRSYYFPDPENRTEEESQLLSTYGMCHYDKEAHAAGTKKGSRKRVGLSAQEVVKALIDIYGTSDYANLVNDNFHDIPENERPTDIENQLTVSYSEFIPFLIGCIKELDQKCQVLQQQISELQNK